MNNRIFYKKTQIDNLKMCLFETNIQTNGFCLDLSGSTALKLVGSDGDSMFVCRAEEELNLDEFDTVADDYDENGPAVAYDIQNLAAIFIGEHDCVFDQVPSGLRSEHLKLMVTTEANAFQQITPNTEFKAELIVERATTDNHKIDDDIYINCPKSGNIMSIYQNIIIQKLQK